MRGEEAIRDKLRAKVQYYFKNVFIIKRFNIFFLNIKE